MSAKTGRALDGLDHLRQSVRDILTTPVGSRVLNREYGSRLFELVDKPTNLSLKMDLIAATIDALARWEPRFKTGTVNVAFTAPGAVTIDADGRYMPDGRAVSVRGIEVR